MNNVFGKSNQEPIQCKGYIFYKSDHIGAGSFSVVYHGVKKNDINNQVAIKVFNQPLNNIPYQTMVKFMEQIIQQITIQSNINKDCVVNILQSGRVKINDKGKEVEKYCIITQLMNQGSLQDIYPEYQKNQQSQVIQIIKKIVNCYKGLYQKKIVHRDIKPHNIMVKVNNNSRVLKLADFGTSRYSSSQTRRTKIGTPQYQSPQQALGNQQKDGKCDIYALGGIFFRLLSGQSPFKGFIDQSTLKANFKMIEEYLQQLKISKKSIAFICKCLQFDQKDRFSWQEVFEHPLLTGIKTYQLSPNFQQGLSFESYISDKMNPKRCIRNDEVMKYISSKQSLPKSGNYIFSIRAIKLDGKNNLRIGLVGFDSEKSQKYTIAYSIKYKTIIQQNKQTEVPKADQCLNQVPSTVSVGLDFDKKKINWIFNGKIQCQYQLQQKVFDYQLHARVCFEEFHDCFQFI